MTKRPFNGKGEHLHEPKSRYGALEYPVSRRWDRHPTILGAGVTRQLEPLRLHEEVPYAKIGSMWPEMFPCLAGVLARVNWASILSPCRFD